MSRKKYILFANIEYILEPILEKLSDYYMIQFKYKINDSFFYEYKRQ